MGMNRIATDMKSGGMNTKDILKALHGNLGNVKEAATILIADAAAAKFNQAVSTHQQDIVSTYEKSQAANREAITTLQQDRRSADSAGNLSANNDQITKLMLAAADKRKAIVDELKRMIGSIANAQTDITTMMQNSSASSSDIKAMVNKHIKPIQDSLKKLDSEMASAFDNDKTIMASSRKLSAQIRETAHAFSIQLPEAEAPRPNK